MFLRRLFSACWACVCVAVLAGSQASAAGEEIVVKTDALVSTQPSGWIDYAVSTRLDAWALGNASCLKIVDFGEVTGDLVFDAATTFQVAPDHRTYTFDIGPGHGFFGVGGPKGPVTAASFKRAFERATSPAMASSIGGTPPARQFVEGIIGASDFFAGTASDISGITASGNVLTIELTEPDVTFRYKLAMPYFCATHESAPPGFANVPLPAAGPYFVSEASTVAAPEPQHVVVLARNPEYGGTRVRNLGSIVWVQHSSTLSEDYVFRAPPSYVPPAGVQIVPTTTTAVQLLALNTSKPPFDDVLTRRAAALALDRTALSSVLGWEATDQFMSPLLPGYADADVYPLGGDPAQATVALGGATPAVTLCHPGGPRAAVAALAKTQLEAVGFQVTLSQPASYFSAIASPATCNLAMLGVTPDFPDGSRILAPLFRGGSPTNFSFYSDAGFDARLDALAGILDESTRLHELADLDAQLSDSAAAIPIGHDRRRDAFADRIGCRLLNQALFGYPVNRLCVSVAQTVPPGGGTVSTGDEATPAAPLQTEVTAPGEAAVSITQGQSSESLPPEYTLLEQQLDITASPAQTAANPYVFTFELDASLLAATGLTVGDVAIYRNGAPVADCTGAGATPDPCVAARTAQLDGDGEIVVRTSAASSWTFGERYDVSGGFLAPAKNPPEPNVETAGRAVPLKFGLGGDEGQSVLAGGSPSSAPASCGSFVPTGPSVAATTNGGVTYDPLSQTYKVIWKTEKAWAGACRVLTLRFREGSTITALVRFT